MSICWKGVEARDNHGACRVKCARTLTKVLGSWRNLGEVDSTVSSFKANNVNPSDISQSARTQSFNHYHCFMVDHKVLSTNFMARDM